MRIHRVVARAFGPFRDEELQLAPGMTVVAGPNEAGKSSWHAALRLALTGVRRGKGPGTVAERALAEHHRPWDQPDRWEVEARLELADGRQVEIHQDLNGKVDCRAVDVGLGRDVSHEILDGTPDASRWLGLTRDSFASTVSVSQAQVLAVTEAADQLQEQMQRAAATQGSDTTAAAAIERLQQFRRDAVGLDRVGARGPLRSAKDRLAAAEARLVDVRHQHEEYLERSAAVEAAERRVLLARRAVAAAEAQLSAAHAAELERRAQAAAELSARYPSAPEALTSRDELADEVAAAIDAWISRPPPVELTGSAAEELERELASLPLPPDGDVEVHPSVRDAWRALELAEAALEALAAEPDSDPAPLPDVDEASVRELARRLRTPQLPGAAPLERQLAEAREAAAGQQQAPGWMYAVAALGVLGALVAAFLGEVPAAMVLALAAAVAGAAGWQGGNASRSARARVSRAEAALAPYREARAGAEQDRLAAERQALALHLPTDPNALDDIADRLATAAATRRAAEERESRTGSLLSRRDAARTALASALAARGVPGGEADPLAACRAYEAGCQSRAQVAATAARREPLQRELTARQAAEANLAASVSATASAESRLRSAAAAAGLEATGGSEELIGSLREWQRGRAARLRENEVAIGEWQRLQSLLDGRTVEALAEEAARARAEAATPAGRAPEAEAGQPVADPSQLESRLGVLREALMSASSEADALRGNLEARREALPDVAEAEEAVLAGRAELERVQRLAATLDATLALLGAAEERVHRSLAPVLAASIGRWLPAISEGAYTDVTVDPADLAVRVKEAGSGRWREAKLLSEGTREQIYLLLRVAMAEHLVVNGETAPLLLDEVTVQSDPDRKRQLLSVLHALSAERQVILFTHDDDVVGWADAALDAGRDSLVLLPARFRREMAVGARPDGEELAAAISVGD